MGRKRSARYAAPAMSGGETTSAPAVGDGRPYWERHANAYRWSLSLLGQALPRAVELARDATRGARDVLEVGAGTGAFTVSIAPEVERLIATDYSVAMLEALRQRVPQSRASNVACVVADIYALPFESGRFDAVIAANVLHLVRDLPAAVRALRRVLAPGGKLVAPTFCHDETAISRILSRILAISGFPGRRRFTSASLRAELERAGLCVARYEAIPGVIPIGYVDGVFDPPRA